MLTSRAVLALGICGIALLGAAPARRNKRPAPPPKTARANPVAQRWMRSLKLEEKVAQLVMMPCYGEAVNTRAKTFRQYQKLVRDVHIGGLIVLGHVQNGTVRNAEPYAMAAFLNRMQKMARVPLLVAADFERGASMRVNSTTAWPYNMAFAAARDLEDSKLEGASTAREARALGVHWIFAPDADVNNNPENPIINIRSYGEDPAEVAAHVRAYIEGAHSDVKNPVLVTAKHFPGHGDTAQDSHVALARLEANRARIDAVELIPFRAAIAAGVDSVMTAHMAVPALEPQNVPATVSSGILTGLLRDQMKFNGIVVTDAMNMQGLTQMFDTGEAAVRALEAGADVLLMPIKAEDAIQAVMAAVKSGRITEQRLDQSVMKVLAAKARVGLARKKIVDPDLIADVIGSPESDEAAQRVAERAITAVKVAPDLVPLSKPEETCVLALTESRYGQQGRRLTEEIHKRAPNLKVTLLDPSMSEADLQQAAQATAGCSEIVVAAYATVSAYRGNGALAGNYPAFLNALIAGKIPVTLVALGNPYLLRTFPNVAAYLATYSPTPTSEAALVRALFGEIPITGKLPVTIPGFAKYGDGLQLIPPNPIQKGL
jgi:beta-N-acetylhexosaminidase